MTIKASLMAGLLAGLASTVALADVQYFNSGKSGFPISDAVQAGNTLYLSGQLGIVPGTGNLAAGGIEGEARQVMDNIQRIAQEHGYAMSDIVKCTVFLADLNEFGAFNEVYKRYFDAARYPARSALGSVGLVRDARVEVECMAAKG